MRNYYSQNGEDFLLHKIFQNKPTGFFVEVGCIDGRRFSNSVSFEEIGWKGMCIEAHAGYIELLKKNRPNSVICHCAAAEEDEHDVLFYANARGSLSTLDKSREAEFRDNFGDYFTGFEEQNVRKRRLDSLFAEFGVNKIDFISIDIEGYEVEALKGIDFGKYKPLVIVVESDNLDHKRRIDEILLPVGYYEIAHLKSNIFYSLDKKHALRINNKKFMRIKLKLLLKAR